jgi:hypothetical protein
VLLQASSTRSIRTCFILSLFGLHLYNEFLLWLQGKVDNETKAENGEFVLLSKVSHAYAPTVDDVSLASQPSTP